MKLLSSFYKKTGVSGSKPKKAASKSKKAASKAKKAASKAKKAASKAKTNPEPEPGEIEPIDPVPQPIIV